MLKDRKAYESTLDAQLAQWSADLDVLKAKAKRAEVDAKVAYDKSIDAIQRKHDEAGSHLRDLKTASDEAWESVKTGTEKVWVEIKTLFQVSTGKA
jgi:hypothetical protein